MNKPQQHMNFDSISSAMQMIHANATSSLPTNLLPLVYKITKTGSDKTNNLKWGLEPFCERFTMPPKIYGNMREKAVRVWNKFAKSDEGIGAIFWGIAGAGKTDTAKMICNIGIDNKLPVILVTEIEFSAELISFISSLKDVIILFDEYGKIFPTYLQDKMLTMFNSLNGKKLFLITENHDYNISAFLKDRPGRAFYNFEFNRLDAAVVEGYARDNGVSEEFLADLLNKYKRATKFSIDHLKAIVAEHLDYPNEKLDDMLEVLNITSLRNKIKYGVTAVFSTMSGKRYLLTPECANITIDKKDFFNNANRVDITLMEAPDKDVNQDANEVLKLPTNRIVGKVSIKQKDIAEIINSDDKEKIVISTTLSSNSGTGLRGFGSSETVAHGNDKINIILTELA